LKYNCTKVFLKKHIGRLDNLLLLSWPSLFT
jgi:hypothetical protein